MGLGVIAPRLLKSPSPDYADEAKRAGIQGTVMLELVITEKGLPSAIRVLSPLGYGLDEKAVDAVKKWRFEPGTLKGEPVPVLANVEVNFHLLNRSFDEEHERRRTRFNVAAHGLNAPQNTTRDGAIRAIRQLAGENYPAALYALGDLTRKGEGVDRDVPRGNELIRKAADKEYGPAIFTVGMDELNAASDDSARIAALSRIDKAATLGHFAAQIFVGEAYEVGAYGPPDPIRAERAFRLCAASGHTDCQYRLGRLLANRSAGKGSLLVESAAWLNLASLNGQESARELLAGMKLTPQQVAEAAKLRAKLQHRP